MVNIPDKLAEELAGYLRIRDPFGLSPWAQDAIDALDGTSERRSEHVCGLQGFGPMDTCRACEEMMNGRSLQK